MVCIGILIGFIMGIVVYNIIHHNKLDMLKIKAKELSEKYEHVPTNSHNARAMYNFLKEIEEM